MKYFLDTNTCIALLRDSSAKVARRFHEAVANDNAVAMSSLVACELWYGIYKSARREQNSGIVLGFLRGPIEVIRFDEEDARAAAAIRAELARTGRTIGSYDTLIAGQSLCKNLIVVTSNVGEFSRVEGLHYEDWAI